MEKVREYREKNLENEEYIKKFSFGLSLNIKLEDYKKIIEKYSMYLYSVYFSLPFGREFHTRKLVIDEYNQENATEKLLKILKLFKENGIKLEAVINQYNINPEKLKQSLKKLDKLIVVDSICCLDEYVDIIDEHYSGKKYLISSFNNGNFNNIKEICSKYDMIVLAKEYMRNPQKIEKIKSMGIDVKLLVNNGCAFNCKSCRAGRKECIKTFKENLKNSTIEKLYAMQSLFPWELKKLIEKLPNYNIIKEIKISSRPCTYEYINNCLDSYIYNKETIEYISENIENYYLWGRQANFIKYYNSFNLENIEKIKRDLWEKQNEEKY